MLVLCVTEPIEGMRNTQGKCAMCNRAIYWHDEYPGALEVTRICSYCMMDIARVTKFLKDNQASINGPIGF